MNQIEEFDSKLKENEYTVISKNMAFLPLYYIAVESHNLLVKDEKDKLKLILIAKGPSGEVINSRFSVIANKEFKKKTHFNQLVSSMSNYYHKYTDFYHFFENIKLSDINEFLICNKDLLQTMKSLNKFNSTFLGESIEMLELNIDLLESIMFYANKIKEL